MNERNREESPKTNKKNPMNPRQNYYRLYPLCPTSVYGNGKTDQATCSPHTLQSYQTYSPLVNDYIESLIEETHEEVHTRMRPGNYNNDQSYPPPLESHSRQQAQNNIKQTLFRRHASQMRDRGMLRRQLVVEQSLLPEVLDTVIRNTLIERQHSNRSNVQKDALERDMTNNQFAVSGQRNTENEDVSETIETYLTSRSNGQIFAPNRRIN
ncbi:hypothetical protein RF11_08023 [Thelohanellus kitauei]|uniref:Uncharacterized protein n=1 Tax=Thelohanellus kitauei TaxID=669202 RepID=A0A0C2M672_THEKT|nr:hypothetical protein RF11_08023 [Thelohanellus kitauei]